MKTIWKLSTFLVLLFTLTACMPDSLTKFKEAPVKNGDDTTSSTGGSGPDEEEEEENEIATVLSNFQLRQSVGHLLVLDLETIGTIKAGDELYSSATMFKSIDRGRGEVIQVQANGSDGSGYALVEVTSTPLLTEETIFEEGFFVDNCSAGYAGCPSGASSASNIRAMSLFLDPTGGTSFSGQFTEDNSNGFDPDKIEYRVVPDLPLGVSLDPESGELSSPVVPFTIANTFDFQEYEFFVQVKDEFLGEDIDEGEEISKIFKISSKLGIEPVTVSEYKLKYNLLNNDRVLITVANTSGFEVGDTVHSCVSSNTAACFPYPNSNINGTGVIYYIDTTNKTLYLTIDTADNTGDFPAGYSIHKDDQSQRTTQIGLPSRLYNSDTVATVITENWEPALDAGVTPSFSLESNISGLSINPTTGDITVNNPQLSTENEYQVTVTNQADGLLIATYIFKLGVFDPPAAISYASSTVNLGINRDEIDLSPVLTPNNFADTANIYYESTGTVAGISFDRSTGKFSGVPTVYTAGEVFTINGFHPRSGSAAFASTTFTVKSATPIDDIHYPQELNEYLKLTLSNVTDLEEGQSLSTPSGGIAEIEFVDSDTNEIIIRLTTTGLTGLQVFKVGDSVDNSGVYNFPKATIEDLVHIFDSTIGISARAPSIAYEGQIKTLSAGPPIETVSYAVSPALGSNFLPLGASDGSIESVAQLPLSTTETRTINILLTNSIGEIVTKEYKYLIKTAPREPSIGRYQFIRLSQNFDRFHIGTRFQTSSNIKGKVVHKIGNSSLGGLLVEAQGTIEAGEGIDNVNPYYAAEAVIQNYAFITLKDSTGILPNNTIVTNDGDTAEVINVNSATHIAYALITTGNFEPGDSISSPANTVVTDVETKHYVSHILELAAAGANFPTGGYISSTVADGEGSADVIFQDSNTLYTQLLDGEFQQGGGVDNTITHLVDETTISKVVGPIVKLTTPLAGTTSTSNHFVEGSVITAVADGGLVHQSAGVVLSATDTGGNHILDVDVKDIKSTNSFNNTNRIDDATPFSSARVGDAHQIGLVSTSSLIPIYVGEDVHIQGKIKGLFNRVTLSPESLPDGLTFDDTTGNITGIPNEPQVRTTYTVTYTSPGDTPVDFSFDLVTYNQFELIQETANAPSYILHKEGQGYGTASCKVLSSQVTDNTNKYQMNDIVCRLEAGELDLYKQGVDLKIKSGAGMCEYIQYVPEAHSSYPAGSTSAYYIQYNNTNSCSGGYNADISASNPLTGAPFDILNAANGSTPRNGEAISFEDKICVAGDCVKIDTPVSDQLTCQYNHVDGPNCDTGSNFVSTVTCIEDADDNSCDCTVSDWIETTCGGEIFNCTSGGIRSTSLEVGSEDSILIDSFPGVTHPLELNSPISQNLAANTVIANSSRAIDCRDPAQDYAFNSYFSGTLSQYLTNYNDASTASVTAAGRSVNLSPTGSSIETSQKFYTYNCLDSSSNIKARIRLEIREWDRTFTPEESSIELGYNTAAPIALVDDATTSCFGESCDRRFDWDSLVDLLDVGSKPSYTSNPLSCMRNGNLTLAGTIGTIMNTNTFTSSSPLADRITRGSVIKVGTNLVAETEFRYYTVTSVTGADTFTTSVNAEITETGLEWELVLDFPFPLDHIED